MRSPDETPNLAKAELFARLAEGARAGITVVTPNRRLAVELAREFDRFQIAAGRQAWESADILPLDAFVTRCYEEILYSDGGAGLPVLLSDAQARELWEETIRDSRWGGELLEVPQTATRAAEAWRLAHAWRIASALEKFEGTDDTRAFAEWARAYARRCRAQGFVDAAVLPDLVAGKTARKPALLVAYAFDIVPPQTADFLSAAATKMVACPAQRRGSQRYSKSFATFAEELESVAGWARAKVEAGAARIGVVVPDLQLRRKQVVRVFSRVMRPECNLPGAARTAMPFNVSLGEPLTQVPVVAAALALLEFAARDVEFENASRLIRSPFLGGGESELAVRARFDARLRREADARLSLPKLIGLADGCPDLRRRLEAVFAVKPATQAPHDWARYWTAVLEAAGYPGERVLDSAEFQARARFNELLGEFARLGTVVARLSAGEALARLRRLCAETLFQPEASAAPVQVLGLLESVGLEFDALWVSGLTDDAWPLAVRPNPFLPVALQKKGGIPEASAETSLALDRRITAGWTGAADEVVFSWPRKDGDRELVASPLASGAEEIPAIAAYPRYRDVIFAHKALRERQDEQGPAVPQKQVHGGTRVLADQAACPFRAFAHWRLGAEALAAPEPGPDARTRGQLLHALMAGLWRELRSSAALAGDVEPAIDKAARDAVQEVGLEGAFAQLEITRLRKLAGEWLARERERGPFEVVHTEQKRQLDVQGLTLNGRIDRMDRLQDGGHVLIDYKTGSRVTPNDWLGARPDDPQLPLYAVAAQERISTVAFARVRAGNMKFFGFSGGESGIPGVKAALDWPALVAGWKKELEQLAGEFAGGHAPVDPKRGLNTCRNCDLQTLCRVHERLSALAEGEEGEAE